MGRVNRTVPVTVPPNDLYSPNAAHLPGFTFSSNQASAEPTFPSPMLAGSGASSKRLVLHNGV